MRLATANLIIVLVIGLTNAAYYLGRPLGNADIIDMAFGNRSNNIPDIAFDFTEEFQGAEELKNLLSEKDCSIEGWNGIWRNWEQTFIAEINHSEWQSYRTAYIAMIRFLHPFTKEAINGPKIEDIVALLTKQPLKTYEADLDADLTNKFFNISLFLTIFIVLSLLEIVFGGGYH